MLSEDIHVRSLGGRKKLESERRRDKRKKKPRKFASRE